MARIFDIKIITIKDAEAKELVKKISNEFKKEVEKIEKFGIDKWKPREPKNASSQSGKSTRYFFKFSNGAEIGAQHFIKSVALRANIFLLHKYYAEKSNYYVSEEKKQEHFDKILPPECLEVLVINNFPNAMKKIGLALPEYAPQNTPVKFIDGTENPILNTTESSNAGVETPEEKEISAKFREVQERPEQPKFREKILKKYNGTCVVTGCTIKSTLDAAHIKSVADGGDYTLNNGLLLRADLHRLFDANLMAIDPDTGKVHFKETGEHYNKYDQKIVDISKASRENLTAHWHKFQTT